MRLLGLSGPAGAGKDYVFEWIRDRSTFHVSRVAFADQVKYDIQNALGSYLPPLWTKPYPREIRSLLQWWGTDLRRSEDPDIWVHRGMADALECDRDALVVFTDVRFGNEADAIRSAGGHVAYVRADHAVRTARIGAVPDHASERFDFPPDFVIDNRIDGQSPQLHTERLAVYLGFEITRERVREAR